MGYYLRATPRHGARAQAADPALWEAPDEARALLQRTSGVKADLAKAEQLAALDGEAEKEVPWGRPTCAPCEASAACFAARRGPRGGH